MLFVRWFKFHEPTGCWKFVKQCSPTRFRLDQHPHNGRNDSVGQLACLFRPVADIRTRHKQFVAIDAGDLQNDQAVLDRRLDRFGMA